MAFRVVDDMLRVWHSAFLWIAARVHQRVFREQLGEHGQRFVGHLSTSVLGGVGAGVLMAAATILAGRLLGPEEYGRYALMLSYAQLLVIPMVMGFDTAAVRYLAADGEETARAIVGTSAAIVLGMVFIVTAGVWMTSGWWASTAAIDGTAFVWATFYAVLLTLRNLSDGFARGFYRFSLQLRSRIIEGFVVLSVFVVAVSVVGEHSFRSYTSAMLAGSAAYFINIAYSFRRYRIQLDLPTSRRLRSYASIAVVGGVAGFLLFNATRIIVERYLGAHALGIYVAYFTASTLVVGQVLGFFNNVFFPTVARMRDRVDVVRRINRLNALLFLPMTVAVMVSIRIVLALYGSAYQFQWALAGVFSVVASTHFFYHVDMWMANAEGIRGVRKTVAVATTLGIVQALLTVALAREHGVMGAAIATLLVNVALWAAFKWVNANLFVRSPRSLGGATP